MKQRFSAVWKSSVQPRKQRKFRANAPLHLRHRMLAAHLSKDARRDYKRRSLPLKKNDEVKVTRGSFRGRTGKVSRVDYKRLKVFVDSVKQKKVSGQEVEVALDPSNLVILKPNMDDPRRIRKKNKK